MRALRVAALLALGVLTSGEAYGQVAAGLVDEVGVSEQSGHVAVTLLFACGLRYLSHDPAGGGERVRVRLVPQPDCGSPAPNWSVSPVIPDRDVVRGIDVDRVVSNTVELSIRWARREQFVVVPSFDARGLRILLMRSDKDRARVTVREVKDASTYAINLDASNTPFPAEAIAEAARTTGVRTYVSETVVDGQRWYRLRAGPFLSEVDARWALSTARTRYPKAWLAVGDDAVLTEPGSPDAVASVPAGRAVTSATLTTPDIERTQQLAKAAFRRKDYTTAIPLLTQLTEQPEYPGRAEAQELLGLARERSGQMAHAKAEYEEYLRRYPDGDAAERTRKRLRAITFAASPASARARAAAEGGSRWKVNGGWSQLYRRDQSGFDNGVTSADRTTQSAVLTDLAVAVRRSGERFDFASRVSGGFGLDLLSDGPGNQSRVTVMFAELSDRELGWTLRGGRQPGGLGGLLGTYDGAYAGYQLTPRLRLNALAGYPVESTRDGPSTNRRFYALSADLGTFAGAWDLSLYAASQEYYGLTDRQAIGGEVRYFRPGLSLVGLVDYDLHYQELNDVLLLGTAALPRNWTLSVNLDHRRSPSLATRNALIGQPVTRFDQLFGLYTVRELEELARDRSATSDVYTLSLSRPLDERWHWNLDLSRMTLGETPGSGGVPATTGTGTDYFVSTQVVGYGLFASSDVETFGLQVQDGDTSTAVSLGLNAQFPIGEAWRIGPRLRVDRREFHNDGSQQLLYAPALRTELRGNHLVLEFEGGMEFGERTLDHASEETSRYYLSLGYRYDFAPGR